MDGGESRRMIKYTGGAQDKTIINQIMLRFRPIAPKPAAGSPDSDVNNLLVSKRRAKRKYVRVRRNNILKKNQNISSSSDQQNGKEIEDASFRKATTMVTLQLLPEKSDKTKESPKRETSWCNQELSRHHHDQDYEENLKLKQPLMVDGEDQAAAAVSKNKIESWVTVECVTETYGCMDIGSGSRGWRCTDVERVKNLEEDRRPGFISDGSDKVRWVNGAYKKMIKEENDEEGQSAESVEIMVYLVTKQNLMPYIYCSALTCWVRLQCRLGANQKYNSKMVPCDVWRMDCGGFAWRLDVEAALSLSLGH